MSLHELYPGAGWILDIEVFDEFGEGHWAQARYLVHSHDDVLWADNVHDACEFLRRSLEAIKEKPRPPSLSREGGQWKEEGPLGREPRFNLTLKEEE